MNMSNRIAELKAELAKEEQKLREEEKKKQEEQAKRWKEILTNPDSFEWKVELGKFGEGGKESAWVTRRVKPEILSAWKEGGFSSYSDNYQCANYWVGMHYYRTDENILTYEGGGTRVLNTPKLCSDEEWEKILANDIPMKFRK